MARRRRGHGEGGVYQRKSDGKCVGSITMGRTKLGRQKRRVVYAATKIARMLDELFGGAVSLHSSPYEEKTPRKNAHGINPGHFR